MNNKLEILRKKLIYRAGHRGTKEMDILLGTFVDKHINNLDENLLYELDKFLDYEDDAISNFYQYNIITKKIDQNEISKLFKEHKI